MCLKQKSPTGLEASSPAKEYVYADSDPTPLATVTANQYRADLVNYTCDNAQHGFSWTVPQSLKDGQPHSMTVKYAGTSIALSGTPANLTCSAGFTVPAAPSNLTATVVSPSPHQPGVAGQQQQREWVCRPARR